MSAVSDAKKAALQPYAAYAHVASATAHEALGRRGALHSAIKPIRHGMRLLGRAFTCRCDANDNLTLHAALKMAQPGDILVCDGGGYTEQGMFGDVMASCAVGRGIAGLLVDGGVRDSTTIAEIGFAVFARSICIKGAVKETLGELQIPVVVGGVTVMPGDLVIGDDDGVCVVPQAEVDALAAKCQAREEKEARFRTALLSGQTTWDTLDLDALLQAKGVRSPFSTI